MPDKPYATSMDATLVGDPFQHVTATATDNGTQVRVGPVSLWSPNATVLLSYLNHAIAAVEKAERARLRQNQLTLGPVA